MPYCQNTRCRNDTNMAERRHLRRTVTLHHFLSRTTTLDILPIILQLSTCLLVHPSIELGIVCGHFISNLLVPL